MTNALKHFYFIAILVAALGASSVAKAEESAGSTAHQVGAEGKASKRTKRKPASIKKEVLKEEEGNYCSQHKTKDTCPSDCEWLDGACHAYD